MPQIPRGSLGLLFWMVVTLHVRSAEGGYDGPRWAFLKPEPVLTAATSITPEKYPDSDDAVVEKRMVRVYRADGTGESQDEAFIKVLTEKGKRGNRSLSLSYMLPYSVAEFVKLELLKPGGEVVAVDLAANTKEMIDDSQMGMNIYDPNSKILRVNIPQLEVGDVVHSITRTTTKRPIIPGEFADENVFEGMGFIRHLSYAVYEPKDKPLRRILLRDEVPGTVQARSEAIEDGTTLRTWDISGVPRMFAEPSMPAFETVLQRLLVSTTPDWETVSKWYWNLCQPHLDATTPDMLQLVKDLTANAKTDLEKTKAIFYHVAQKIRYMGLTPEKDRPGFEPHDVKLTFANKYGVCRDKAALLVSLLNSAGLKAFPVLVSVGVKKDPEVPEPFFNHAIVAVELQPGRYQLMDPTAENTKDLLPSYECDQSYLVCRPEGDGIRTSPVIPPEENMMRVRTTASLTLDGTLHARSHLEFDGINDNSYREAFSRMKPDDQRRFFEENLKSSMPGAKLKSLSVLPVDAMDVSTPLTADLEFDVDGMTAAGAGKAVVGMPWIGRNFGIVSFILGGTGLEKRKYPLRTDIACGLQEEIVVELQDGYREALSQPSYAPIDDSSLSYQRQVELKDGRLVAKGEFKLKTVEFSPTEYLRLKETLKTLEYDARKAPVLTTASTTVAAAAPLVRGSSDATPVESNVRILESRKELRITDAHSATLTGKFRKEILNYSGKKSEAEFKLHFNPACETARVIHAVVLSKTGQRQELTTNEVNVMDAGWNASAKRYTGGKILVANLPGVDVGSILEVEYEVASRGRPFVGGFETFQTFDALEKKTFDLVAPRDLKVHTLPTGRDGVVIPQTGPPSDGSSFRWTGGPVSALPAESQLPPDWTYLPGIQYFVGDHAAYLRELHQTLLSRSAVREKTAQQARHLIAQRTDPKAKVVALRNFVAKSIRLAGPSYTELPLAELSPADTTLTDGYGHVADRAILLHGLLASVGLSPEFILASGLPPISGITNVASHFPLPHQFQSLLVRVRIDGEDYYLNDTDQYSQLGSTGFDGRLSWNLASGVQEVIRAPRDARHRTETTYTLELDQAGRARLGMTRRFFGGAYNSLNRYFSELPPEQRKRYHQELVSSIAQGARPVGDLVTRFDTYPGVEQVTVDIDHFQVIDGRYSYFDLPFTPSLMGGVAERRTLPFYVGYQSENVIRTEITLPPGFPKSVIAPTEQFLVEPAGAGQARVTISESGRNRILTHEFVSSPAIISPQDYPAVLQVEAALGRKSAKTFLLEAGAALP